LMPEISAWLARGWGLGEEARRERGSRHRPV